MKIGVNSRIYQNANTGIPYFIESLYATLQEIDRKDQYVFFQTNKSKKLGDTKTLKIFSGSIGAILFDLLFVGLLTNGEKIDIFHGPSYTLPLFKKKGVRYVVTVHDLSFFIFKNQFRLLHAYYRFAIGKALDKADAIIADSKSTKRDIEKYFSVKDKKIYVVYLGVSKIFFQANKTKRIVKDKYFFSITTHPKRKNIFRILQVLSTSKGLSSHKYVIAGLIDKKQLEELKTEIMRLNLSDRVIFFGYATVKELVNLYRNADFFIYPSFYEGFGFPVLEAMASRCPVITSNNSSLVELVPDKTWLIDPYDTNDISNRIDKLLKMRNNDRNKLIQKNYEFAKKFTWHRTAKAYLDIFNDLVK